MEKIIKQRSQPSSFLAKAGAGRKLLALKPGEVCYSHGEPADAVYYMRSGQARLTVLSRHGKEAVVTKLAPGDFFGEEALSSGHALRSATAAAISACSVLRIERERMLQALHEERAFSDIFLQFVVRRGSTMQADLIDQLFNSSERRLARTLLLMAQFGETGEPEPQIPRVTNEVLAEMIGTTRAQVRFFMVRFRKLGYIDEKNGRIRVNKALLSVVLRDSLPEQNASRPALMDPPHAPAAATRRAKRVRATVED